VAQHPGGVLGAYGVDLANPAAPLYLDPDTNHDIMTYCGPRWISDITFDALRDSFRPAAAAATWQAPVETPGSPGQSAAQQEHLTCSGSILGGVVTMTRPCYRSSSSSDAGGAGQGRYTLEIQDAGGAALFTRRFDTVGDSEDPVEGTGHFRQTIPWQHGTARIVIRDGQAVLHTIPVSEHAPQVTLLAPNGGEAWPPYGEHLITWAGSDEDGDPLHYDLLYSADGGTTWRGLAAALEGASYVLDAGRLPGSAQALLQVIATDGVNTAQDTSDADFAVEGKPPVALIVYPIAGQHFLPGQPVILEGGGTDLEDGPLTNDTRFRWRSSIEGELGVGRRLFFDDLLPGWHTLTLEVADNDGYIGQNSVSIFIGNHLYLPVVFKTGQ